MEKKQAQTQEVVTAPKDNTTTRDIATSKDNTTSDNVRILEINTDRNCDFVLSATSIKAIENYLTSSLKNLREDNKHLAEQYRQLQNSYDVKVNEKFQSLNKINTKVYPNMRLILKQIQMKQLTVLHQMKWMIDNETQIARAYDKHCKTAIDKTEKQHQLVKTQAYDKFTKMTSDELAEAVKSCKEKLVLNKAEAERWALQLDTEEDKYKAELINVRNSLTSMEDLIRETCEMCQALQLEKTLRGPGRTPM